MNRSKAHHKLVKDIVIELSRDPNIRVWENPTGVARDIEDDERVIRFGLKGSADIIGVMGPHGKILCIEVKTGSAVQSTRQINFMNMIRERGGVYILARSVQDAVKGVTCHDRGA